MPDDLRITRNIAATPDELYDAWTDPQSVMEWMIPMPGGSTRATLDPRVGGRFQIDMMGNGKTYPHEGEYLRLERPRLIEFTWISMATNRQRSIVTIEFRPVGKDTTELTLTHRQLPAESLQSHEQGWTNIFDHLAAALTKSTDSR